MTTDKTHLPEFQELSGLLWRVLGALAKRGYFVPPEDGQDILHDFYLDAWPTLKERFDARKGEASSYVATAFYQFARRKLLQSMRWRQALVDVKAVEDWPASEPQPPEIHELMELRRSLERAIVHLSKDERTLIGAYLALEEPSERKVAEALGVTRHQARHRLSEVMGRLNELVHAPGSVPERDRRDGSWRQPLKELTGESVQKQAGAKEKAVMKTYIDERDILSKIERAAVDWQRAIISGREADSLPDDTFSDAEIEYLRENPHLLARLYEGDSEQPEPELEGLLAQHVQDETTEIKEAFRMLPLELRLGARKVIESSEDVEVRRGLDDLVPLAAASAMRGLVLLFDEALEPSSQRKRLPGDFAGSSGALRVLGANRESALVSESLWRTELRATPYVPPECGEAFCDWVVAVLSSCPAFVKGYEVTNDGVFQRRPAQDTRELPTLWAVHGHRELGLAVPTLVPSADVPDSRPWLR